MQKIVIVVGMHRTGSSMIGGILEKLGINMGKNSEKKNFANPFGYFEDQDLKIINEKILNEANGKWDNPPKKESIIAIKEKVKQDILNFLNGKKKPIWGIKDPRLSLTLNLFLPYLDIENTYFIITHRNHSNIVNSLKRRDNFTVEKSIKLINQYEKNLQEILKANNFKKMDVYYEKILSNPCEWVFKIKNFCNLKPDKFQILEAVHFITPNEIIRKLSRLMKIKEAFSNPNNFLNFFFLKIKYFLQDKIPNSDKILQRLSQIFINFIKRENVASRSR